MGRAIIIEHTVNFALSGNSHGRAIIIEHTVNFALSGNSHGSCNMALISGVTLNVFLGFNYLFLFQYLL